ncbi:hypothetical protein BV22DRAFT_1136817 [Leucogyrophana mollusca]|uniref:Uncharacterized protein n=1 Tax=Leucogyrophana mollusca TaxID=85980 RepID=A0ACB8BYZ3_9AGAM|nr:hypothetical protein BV22DRAFT_1136817 [Leucogyrophana mollusca]
MYTYDELQIDEFTNHLIGPIAEDHQHTCEGKGKYKSIHGFPYPIAMNDESSVNQSTRSSQRLVWCDCNECKQADTQKGGQSVPVYLHDNHRRTQNLSQSAIALRGRGRTTTTLGQPASTIRRGRATPRGAQVQPQASSSRSVDEPAAAEYMDIGDDFPAPFESPPQSPPALAHAPPGPMPPMTARVPRNPHAQAQLPPSPLPFPQQVQSPDASSSSPIAPAPPPPPEYVRVRPLQHPEPVSSARCHAPKVFGSENIEY